MEQLNADVPSRSRPASGSSESQTTAAGLVESGVAGSTNSPSAAALDLRLTDNTSNSAAGLVGLAGLASLHNLPLQELTARLELRTDLVPQQPTNPPGEESEILRKVQQEKSNFFSIFFPLFPTRHSFEVAIVRLHSRLLKSKQAFYSM